LLTGGFAANLIGVGGVGINGCHLRVRAGTWFPHNPPFWWGLVFFFDEVEKNTRPHGKAVARGSVRFLPCASST
jgi:hypothetical protein